MYRQSIFNKNSIFRGKKICDVTFRIVNILNLNILKFCNRNDYLVARLRDYAIDDTAVLTIHKQLELMTFLYEMLSTFARMLGYVYAEN